MSILMPMAQRDDNDDQPEGPACKNEIVSEGSWPWYHIKRFCFCLFVYALTLYVHLNSSYLYEDVIFRSFRPPSGQMKIANSIVSNHSQNTTVKKQRVVLLVGPHKTASTSIQKNLFYWVNDENHASNLAQSWSLPTPIDRFRAAGCSVDNSTESLFNSIVYWWIKIIQDEKISHCWEGPNGKRLFSKDEFLEFYKEEYLEQWMKGKNLVIASEGMDRVGKDVDGKQVLQYILGLLPWNSKISQNVTGGNEDITVVVMYRSPRSIHLQSLWHQCCMENEPFEHYIATVNSRGWFPFYYLDSLNLAKRFLQWGLKVVLIDMAGVSDKRYDISNIVACDILGANCSPQKRFYGQSAEGPIIANTKNSNHSVTQEQMQMIDEAIENYECNFLSLADHHNLTILYEDALPRVFSKCRERSSNVSVLDKNGLLNKISRIAKNN